MAQSLELNIRTTSDVPQAMDKAKAATSSFDKQISDIGKKFGTSFKDIFLSFLGPMALVTAAIGIVAKMIADNQRKTEEANKAAIDGTNELMSAEDRYYAKKRENLRKSAETKEEAATARVDVTETFLRTDPRGQKLVSQEATGPMAAINKGAENLGRVLTLGGDTKSLGIALKRKSMSEDKAIQDAVQKMIAEDMAKNPLPETKTEPEKPTSFKSPEGFSNVVGMGANPVIEAMTAQLEEARKQTILLESLNNKATGGGVPTDFTKSTSPSRAALLKGGN